MCFKKIKKESINNFEWNNSADKFTMMENIISRHFSRLNNKRLVLAETVSWYQFTGEEKSKEVYGIFKDTIDKIPASDVECISRLVCQNGDVLKR